VEQEARQEAREAARRKKQKARQEGSSDNQTGFFGVYLVKPGQPKPYQAKVWGPKLVHLGSFATAEEASLCIARSPEGQAAAAVPPPMTGDEARQQALAEELTMRTSNNKTGFFGVYLVKPGQPKPYQAKVKRGPKLVHLGSFATAEEASLCIARSPEGQAAAAVPPPMTGDEARQQALAEELTMRTANNQTGFFGVRLHKPGTPKPYLARVNSLGKKVVLGLFATAEEASLCVARSPEGRAAAAGTPPPPRT
jgi:hypothetical protein